MSDYPLSSTWAEVDAAAQAVKNGLPKANLSGAVQASLDKADTAYRKPPDGISIYDLKSDVQQSIHRADESAQRFWVTITRENNVYSCDRTLAQIQAAYEAGKYIRANLPDGFQSDFANNDDGAMFYVFDDSGGSMMLMRYTVGASAVTFQSWPVGGQGITDEAKIALLECFQNTAWEGTDGIDYYNRLYSALFGTRTLDSISAVYTQTDLVLTTDTLESLRKNLIVTAHYSNGGDYAVSLYELSGTLTKGESTITATYAGKSTTFTVNVTLNTAPVITRTDAFLGYVSGSYEDMPKAGCGITEMYTLAEEATSLYPAGILPTRSLNQMKSGNYNACLVVYNENGAPRNYLTEVSSSFNRWLQNATGTMTEYKNEWTVGAYKKIAFSVDMDYLDRAYMYDYNTGRVFFAGRNTPYWGMENVSEAGGD